MTKIDLKLLLDTGAHFGHQVRRWNPKMKDYIHSEEDGVHIFDLTKTKVALEEALKVLEETAKAGKEIMFVGTKKQAKEIIEKTARELNSPWVNERWLGGALSNFDQIRKSIEKLHQMKKQKEEGEFKKFTKKERGLLDREIERLERFFGGIAELKELPDLIFAVDVKKEMGAVTEAKKKGIEVIAIVDSNCDPDLVDYPIPMNDDAVKAIEYVLSLVKEAVLKGQKSAKVRSK